jgi:hypothetical protein
MSHIPSVLVSLNRKWRFLSALNPCLSVDGLSQRIDVRIIRLESIPEERIITRFDAKHSAICNCDISCMHDVLFGTANLKWVANAS